MRKDLRKLSKYTRIPSFNDTRLHIDMDLYPLEHFGFSQNYAFSARKKQSADFLIKNNDEIICYR